MVKASQPDHKDIIHENDLLSIIFSFVSSFHYHFQTSRRALELAHCESSADEMFGAVIRSAGRDGQSSLLLLFHFVPSFFVHELRDIIHDLVYRAGSVFTFLDVS